MKTKNTILSEESCEMRDFKLNIYDNIDKCKTLADIKFLLKQATFGYWNGCYADKKNYPRNAWFELVRKNGKLIAKQGSQRLCENK